MERRFSHQREEIYQAVRDRRDHPSAEWSISSSNRICHG